jgi:hypothetical protein
VGEIQLRVRISDPPGAVVRRSLRLTGAMELPDDAAR